MPLTSLLRKYFGPLLAGLMLLRILSMTLWMAVMIPAWLDLTFPEGSMVATSLDVARGRPAYQDWRQWPHAFAPYAPATYYPVGWTARALSAKPSPRLVYLVGRGFAFASVLGIFALIYLLGRQLGLGRIWSLAAVGVFSHWQMLLEFGTSFRPDAPKTFFSLLALWLVLRSPRGSWRVLAAALASLYVSLWIKPTAWAEGLIVAAWTWRRFGARRALAIGAGFIASGLIPIYLLNRHFHGALLQNITATMNFGYTLDVVSIFFSAPLRWENLVLESALVLACVMAWRPEEKSRHLFWWGVLLAILIDIALMLKGGSDINYLFDAYALATLAVVTWVARLWCGESRLPRAVREGVLWLIVTPLVIWGAAQSFSTIRTDFRGALAWWDPPPIQRFLAGRQGAILSTVPSVTLAVSDVNGVMDFSLYGESYRRGLLDPEPLLGRIRRHQFDFIVLPEGLLKVFAEGTPSERNLFCPDFMPTVRKYYRVERVVGTFRVYVPAG